MNTWEMEPKKPGRPRKTFSAGKPLNQVTVHLPPELVSALDREMGIAGIRSRSELIREACQTYLAQRKEHAQNQSLTQRMRDMSQSDRKAVMAAAASSLAEYYRTDPEIQEWQALDTEDFFDSGD